MLRDRGEKEDPWGRGMTPSGVVEFDLEAMEIESRREEFGGVGNEQGGV